MTNNTIHRAKQLNSYEYLYRGFIIERVHADDTAHGEGTEWRIFEPAEWSTLPEAILNESGRSREWVETTRLLRDAKWEIDAMIASNTCAVQMLHPVNQPYKGKRHDTEPNHA